MPVQSKIFSRIRKPEKVDPRWIAFLNYGENRSILWNLDDNDSVRGELLQYYKENRTQSDDWARYARDFEEWFSCPWSMRDSYRLFIRLSDLFRHDPKLTFQCLTQSALGEAETDNGERLDFSYLLEGMPEYDLSEDSQVAYWEAQEVTPEPSLLEYETWNGIETSEDSSPLTLWQSFLGTKESETTRKNYGWRLNTCARYLGVDCEDFLVEFLCNPEGIASSVRRAMETDGKTASFFRCYLSTLKSFAAYLTGKGIVERQEIEVPSEQRRWTNREDNLSESEIDRIQSGIEGLPETPAVYHASLFSLLYYHGLRRHEALSLRVCDIGPDCLYIKEKGRNDRNRIKALPETLATLAMLSDIVKRSYPLADDTASLFPSLRSLSGNPHSGNPESINLATLNRIVSQWGSWIDRPEITPHSFRRCIATVGKNAGLTPTELGTLLRHSTLRTQDLYFTDRGSMALKALETVAGKR